MASTINTVCPVCGSEMEATSLVHWRALDGQWFPIEATLDEAVVECPRGCPKWAMEPSMVQRIAGVFADAVRALSRQIVPQHPVYGTPQSLPPTARAHAASGPEAKIIPMRGSS